MAIKSLFNSIINKKNNKCVCPVKGIKISDIDLSSSVYSFPFKKRVSLGYQKFIEREENLRTLISDKNNSNSDIITALCSSAFEDVYDFAFELGFNGTKYDLIFSPDGSAANTFVIDYFKKYAPDEIADNWNILIGRQPSRENFGIRAGDIDMSTDDFVFSYKLNNNHITLDIYNEKLLPDINNNEDDIYWLLYVMVDNIIGELAAMKYIDGINLSDKPLYSPIPLKKLGNIIEDTFGKPENGYYTADIICESYSVLENPNPETKKCKADKSDVLAAVSCCPDIIINHSENDMSIINMFNTYGIDAGYLAYPINNFNRKESSAILDYRDYIQNKITDKAGNDAVSFIGGASGVFCSYLDFIAWDKITVINAASEIFKTQDKIDWAVYHSFNNDEDFIIIK